MKGDILLKSHTLLRLRKSVNTFYMLFIYILSKYMGSYLIAHCYNLIISNLLLYPIDYHSKHLRYGIPERVSNFMLRNAGLRTFKTSWTKGDFNIFNPICFFSDMTDCSLIKPYEILVFPKYPKSESYVIHQSISLCFYWVNLTYKTNWRNGKYFMQKFLASSQQITNREN